VDLCGGLDQSGCMGADNPFETVSARSGAECRNDDLQLFARWGNCANFRAPRRGSGGNFSHTVSALAMGSSDRVRRSEVGGRAQGAFRALDGEADSPGVGRSAPVRDPGWAAKQQSVRWDPAAEARSAGARVPDAAAGADARYRVWDGDAGRRRPTQGDVVLFLAYTGPRRGETAALRVSRVNLARHRVDVAQAVSEPRGVIVWGTPEEPRATISAILRTLDRCARTTTGRLHHLARAVGQLAKHCSGIGAPGHPQRANTSRLLFGARTNSRATRRNDDEPRTCR
jgi:hypothetical protein